MAPCRAQVSAGVRWTVSGGKPPESTWRCGADQQFAGHVGRYLSIPSLVPCLRWLRVRRCHQRRAGWWLASATIGLESRTGKGGDGSLAFLVCASLG